MLAEDALAIVEKLRDDWILSKAESIVLEAIISEYSILLNQTNKDYQE